MERKLKLVKNEPENGDQKSASRLTDHASRMALLPLLTSAERAEAVHFKALTVAKAARQARLRRMMAHLDDLAEVPPAA